MSHGDQAKLSSMGISGGGSLLVYQWDDMPGPGATKLGKEDENMPAMQSVANGVAYLISEAFLHFNSNLR